MCSTCGCSDDAGVRITDAAGVQTGEHGHAHDHDHPHSHPHEHPGQDGHDGGGHETIALEERLLAKNELLAARNRGWLEGRGIRAFNLMSSPGAGKTTLLERTIRDLGDDLDIQVIEGDQETSLDADRIRAAGRPVVQINTGAGCHLDAQMLRRGLDALDPAAGSTLFIENVGNLVCPALFDLGETAKVVIISVTEGDGKPRKYPHMFMAADLILINKADLLPYVKFDVEDCIRQARMLNPHVEVLVVSATAGDGLDGWYGWLTDTPGAPAAGTAGHRPHNRPEALSDAR
ncbi:hydrogenase nickel incorporation protein HypB [Arthrobacter sp. I2-34]|uniref:Hydrogenase nickel incorporation protein HypB n=1 Tax=Arthrobacter hankyongi TaxID=2904801 RepID=A0ABS9L888_9MICC|nr:hydrogenase nickel incorporation protein HypB [Arthrobacter hankyongi]MCG2622887.1 hydrogenase nickel incorporation protein HypB [Arthrobacter hankyongi]